MRNNSHTLISTVRDAVNAWRKSQSWSRETVSQHIVETYHRLDGDQVTDLRFDPETRDAYERTKVMADRIYRWLDDDTKDTNLLPANFLPYILAALPMDIRIECVDQLLGPTGLCVHIPGTKPAADLTHVLQATLKEGGEAQAALVNLLDGATLLELQKGQRELTEAIGAFQEGQQIIEGMILASSARD